jgi:hypothetical protein
VYLKSSHELSNLKTSSNGVQVVHQSPFEGSSMIGHRSELTLGRATRAWTRKGDLMSLESSHEHAEQEPPRSATSTETDHSPVVQGDNQGEQPPADVTSELEALISNQKQALQRAAALNDTGIAAWHQYRIGGQMADLNRAVVCWQESLSL